MAIACVTVIGTSHDFQVQWDSEYAELASSSNKFHIYLCSVCAKTKFGLIGEELNYDHHRIKNGKESIASLVAKEYGTNHSYCDPTLEQRRMLGIDKDRLDAIYIEIANDVCMEEVERTSEDVQMEVQRRYNSHPEIIRANTIRECFWLTQIARFDATDILFICGAYHVATFSRLLRARDYTVQVEVNDWSPV